MNESCHTYEQGILSLSRALSLCASLSVFPPLSLSLSLSLCLSLSLSLSLSFTAAVVLFVFEGGDGEIGQLSSSSQLNWGIYVSLENIQGTFAKYMGLI